MKNAAIIYIKRYLCHTKKTTIMKSFIKQTLAVVLGLIVFSIISGILCIFCLAGMIAAMDTETVVKDGSVMVIDLTGTMEERGDDTPDIIGWLGGGDATETIGLDNMLEAIHKAKDNDKIKGIYIKAGLLQADSYASLSAVRDALADFRKSGKWIVAYGDTYTQGTYYVCSVADKVIVNPQGIIDWHGLAAQTVYVKDLLAKVGVKMQLSKVGKYKSAPDMFTADKMSDNDREQITAYINGIWGHIVDGVAESRALTADELNALADEMTAFSGAQTYVDSGMADTLAYACDVDDIINSLLGNDDDDDISTIAWTDMENVKDKQGNGARIAVYYAYGDIVDNEEQSLLSRGSAVINAVEVCEDLEELADDDDIYAVVLRVNSGGGSAYASEQIWNTMMKLKEKKPVVVSMGGKAASGGYYISCGADRIVAEPVTLTGSIGIFGMFPDMSELMTKKLGLKYDGVYTNKHSDFGTTARPFNAEEMAIINAYIERGYQLFISRVAAGRGMTTDEVDAIGQGRVWTGKDALNVGLVDQLGGLDDAIAEAAKLAKIEDYSVAAYPEKESWADRLINSFTAESCIDSRLRSTLGELYEPLMLIRSIENMNPVQARVMYYINEE